VADQHLPGCGRANTPGVALEQGHACDLLGDRHLSRHR
jgi:hypothetical protein